MAWRYLHDLTGGPSDHARAAVVVWSLPPDLVPFWEQPERVAAPSSLSMTHGTVHTFDARRGRGMARCAGGALVPFSAHVPVVVGDQITLSVTGGKAGVYGRFVQAA